MNNNREFNQNIQNNNINNMNLTGIPRDAEDSMYPEIYHRFMPVVDQLIKDMEKKYGEIYLTEDLLKQMTDEAIRRSGIDAAPIPVDNMTDADAVPTFNEFEHGRRGGGNWRRYDRGAFSDIFRILLLQQLFGRRRSCWRCR